MCVAINTCHLLHIKKKEKKKKIKYVQTSGRIMDGANPFSTLFEDKQQATAPTADTKPAVNIMAQKVNALIEQVFYITINRTPQKNKQLVFMDELAATNPSIHLINVEALEQVLFERLLLPQPSEYLIPNNVQNDDTPIVSESRVLLYLYGAYERLCRWNRYQNDNSLVEEYAIIEQLIFRNASTANKQPDLFDCQNLSEQWLELLKYSNDEYEYRYNFLTRVVRDVYSDNDPAYDTSISQIFNNLFQQVHATIRKSSLVTIEQWILPLLMAFVSDKSNPKLAKLLLDYTTPRPSADGTLDGIRFAESLLGQLLCISIMPKNHNGPYEYYESIADAQSQSLNASLWGSLKLHLDQLHGLLKGFLLVGGEVRSQMLDWIGLCLSKNQARGQLWNAHNPMSMLGGFKTVPDSFMIGLCGVLLRLCKPLLRPTYKVLDVDPTYFAVSDTERIEKGVHMLAIDKETCLRPVEENQTRKTAASYNFVTEVFYMTHKAIDLGYRVCIDRFFQANREISRLQHSYQDAQMQGSGAAENIMQLLTAQMPQFLCLQNLIIEPTNDQLLVQFYEATALWLTQAAAKIPDPNDLEKEINAPSIELPISTPPPKILSSIPEFTLENIIGYLTFIRHFNNQTIDTDSEAQRNIFTLILAFMGDVERARNPHLRARLAEGLESLLPKENASAFGGNIKSLLFAHHPHRLEIVPNLLSVFVGIEMTGQNVQFEQKFNYRRPMYVIMDYLWKIEEQRECFKRLAAHALEQMEAVNPPIFLRFVNLLINDAIYLLDESLSNLQQIRQLQHAQDNGEWNSLPANERQQNLANMQQLGNFARFDNILGRDTINTLKMLTSEVPEIFCHPSMVDRVAAMLNYFLLHLVGPNKGNFKVSCGVVFGIIKM